MNHFHADLLVSDLETSEVRQLMYDYVVDYDMDAHLFDDRIILDMICEVNVDAELPGYRFVILFMPEFNPLFSYEGALSSQMITADDLEFFLKSAYLSVEDHIIGESRVMPLRAYFVTPPDLEQNINHLLNKG